MAYREENGQVVLTMPREDYEMLLLWLGMTTGGILKDGDNADGIIAFLNRLKRGQPELHALRGQGVSANFVAELPKPDDPPPSCHVCGAPMGKSSDTLADNLAGKYHWLCLRCGATTECS